MPLRCHTFAAAAAGIGDDFDADDKADEWQSSSADDGDDDDEHEDGGGGGGVFALSPPESSVLKSGKRRATFACGGNAFASSAFGCVEVEVVSESVDLEPRAANAAAKAAARRSLSCYDRFHGVRDASAADNARVEAFGDGESVGDAELCAAAPPTAANVPAKPHLDDFILISVVGRGAFGKVFLVQKKDSGQFFAMKMLKKADIVKSNVVKHAKSERSVLVAACHPFVVQLRFAFQTPSKLYLILDFIAGGELFTRLNQVQFFLADTAAFYAAEIVLAIDHLHQQGILYRDLKPENVMLQADGHICLTDMGLAKHDVEMNGSRSFCGTAAYMAPEVIRKAAYGKAADWWSLGALLYEMLSGHVPFESSNAAKLHYKILNAKLHFPRHFNNAAKNILKRLLNRNPEHRLGAKGIEEITSHTFFVNIRWEALEKKQVSAPFVPPLQSEVDVSAFETTFTCEDAVVSDTDSDALPLSESVQQHFAGFSFH